jgi:tetratricopeptide (TPR) repeat protein
LVAALSLALLVIVLGGGLLLRRLMAPIVLPAPRASLVQEPVRWEDFVGAEACAGCHQPEYAAWRSSTHAHAGGAPGRDVVIARFNGVPIRFKDATVTPRVAPGGTYEFAVSRAGQPTVVLTVSGVIGGGHMAGGGTQGFVSRYPDGTVRFLPFDFIRRESVWFCNTIGRGEKGWIPITPELPLEACVDWPPQRVLGTDARWSNCQECHGSQIELRFDAGSKGYATRYQDLRINCESCHGPGRRHIELARAGGLDTATDIGLRSLTTLSKDQSLDVCFQCHALKDVLQPDYLPGKSLAGHYSLGLEWLGEKPWFPDGRVRTFAYQQNHRFSDCYLNGSMTCVDCHEPHSQAYRDVTGRPLAGRFDDGQCVDCHASKADRIEQHTHHRVGSSGSNCVACHMPYLQHPELGTALRFARSDHTIAIPRPAFDARLGIKSACVQCHTDLSVEQLQRASDQWWGEVKPHPPLVAALLAAGDSGALTDSAALTLLRPDLDHPMAQIGALGALLDRYLQPDMPRLPGVMVERLKQLATKDDPDVSALALSVLHFSAGDRRGVRRFLARTLAALGDREPLIRSRWRLVLAYLGDTYHQRGDERTALVAYRRALEIVPDDAAVLGSMGLAYAGAGKWPEAVEAYRRSLSLDPRQPLTLVNLGLALEAQGDQAGALGAYQQALGVDPREPVALLNLGNVYFRQGDAAQATEYYQRAIAANAGLAPAHFNLGRVYALGGKLAQARSEIEQGLAFEPGNSDGLAMLQELNRVLERK